MRISSVFLVVTTGLFLCPGPSFWYSLLQDDCALKNSFWSQFCIKFQLFLINLEDYEEINQLAAHFFLMLVCSLFLSKELLLLTVKKDSNDWPIKRITLLFIFLFSFLIEVIQSLLPISFKRGFDWMDILVSTLGGFFGVIISYFSLRNINNAE